MAAWDAGDKFQEETKYHRWNMPRAPLDWAARPDMYKEYDPSRRVPLPPHGTPESISLHECVKARKSERRFADSPLSLQDISYLLWASTGIQREEDGYLFRTSPSAGALYPIETYVGANRVGGLAAGIYHYNVRGHSLEEVSPGQKSDMIASAALDQRLCSDSPAVFIWSAVFPRCKWKYGQRAYRYVYLDVGHIAAQLSLAAVCLGLGSCQIAALYDNELNALIGADGKQESAIYMTAIGHPSN